MKLSLNYKITDLKERQSIVEKICKTHSNELNEYNLEALADYILNSLEKEERKQKKILNDNRMSTVKKREVSMEGLVEKFKTGEDGFYQIIRQDKNMLLSPAHKITKKDYETIPFLSQIKESIDLLKQIKNRNYIAHAAIINLFQTQYIVKEAYLKPARSTSYSSIDVHNKNWIDYLDFTNPDHVSALLKGYSKIKSEYIDVIEGDMYWILIDFENLIEEKIKDDFPIYYDILISRIEGVRNETIQTDLFAKFGKTYSIEYISSLFNQKIPKLIALKAKEMEVEWYYTVEKKGNWKQCGRCGQIKLAHPLFFSLNKSSKDGYYSICKKCRNQKKERQLTRCI